MYSKKKKENDETEVQYPQLSRRIIHPEFPVFEDKSRRSVVLSMNSITVMGGRRVMPRIYTRPRGGIHSSGLSFVVGGKLVKFALSAQARGGREGRRGEKRSRGSTCCRVSASPCDLCAVTAPPTCIYAWKLLLHRPNISLLMFHRDALFEGVATSICQNILKAIDRGPLINGRTTLRG